MALGESGEICIRGPQVMAGYWQRPDETAKVMSTDGYFKSGDVGIMDENGYTRIVDRKKDMVLVSGFNVYPSELEEVAMKCPGVQRDPVHPAERVGGVGLHLELVEQDGGAARHLQPAGQDAFGGHVRDDCILSRSLGKIVLQT